MNRETPIECSLLLKGVILPISTAVLCNFLCDKLLTLT
jgi:hypothetical protein